MATVTHKPIPQEQRPGVHEADLVVGRVALYLQNVGLDWENALDAARWMVREVQTGNGEDRLWARAMDWTVHRVDQWLDELAASCPTPTVDLRTQLRWHVRPVLQRHPEGFLRLHDLHDDFPGAVRAAARPILPPSAPAAMPSASLGDLPHPWQRAAAYAALVRHRFTSLLWRTRTRS
jgi:hypothetical protein